MDFKRHKTTEEDKEYMKEILQQEFLIFKDALPTRHKFVIAFYFISLLVFVFLHFAPLEECRLCVLIHDITGAISGIGLAAYVIRFDYMSGFRSPYGSSVKYIVESDEEIKEANHRMLYFIWLGAVFFLLLILTLLTFHKTKLFAILFIFYTLLLATGFLWGILFGVLIEFFEYLKDLFTHRK